MPPARIVLCVLLATGASFVLGSSSGGDKSLLRKNQDPKQQEESSMFQLSHKGKDYTCVVTDDDEQLSCTRNEHENPLSSSLPQFETREKGIKRITVDDEDHRQLQVAGQLSMAYKYEGCFHKNQLMDDFDLTWLFPMADKKACEDHCYEGDYEDTIWNEKNKLCECFGYDRTQTPVADSNCLPNSANADVYFEIYSNRFVNTDQCTCSCVLKDGPQNLVYKHVCMESVLAAQRGPPGYTCPVQPIYDHCTHNPYTPFPTKEELVGAINVYLSSRGQITWETDARLGRTYGPTMNDWNLGNLTDLGGLFAGRTSFNEDISRWCTGKVTNFMSMFSQATAFNVDISNWDTSGANQDTAFRFMFDNATSFGQNLSSWSCTGSFCYYQMFRWTDPRKDGLVKPSPCTVGSGCYSAPVTYSLDHNYTFFCSNGNTAVTTEYQGYICAGSGDNAAIQWTNMTTINPNNAYPGCAGHPSWDSAINDDAWDALFVGGCGIAPTFVPELPTTVGGLSA